MKKTHALFVMMPVFFIGVINVFAQDNVEIHGYVAQGYLQSSDNNYLAKTHEGTYELSEFGLNFQYFPSDKVNIGAQLGGRDLGDVGNDEVQLNWAFGDYRWKEWLGFRAGVTQSPVSLYGQAREVDALRTWVIMPSSVYDEWTKDSSFGLKGVGAFGNVDMASAGILQYELRSANLQVDTDSGTGQLLQTFAGLTSVDAIDFKRLLIGSLRWQTPLDGLRLSTDYVTYRKSVIDGQVYNPLAGMNIPAVFTTKESEIIYYGIEYIWGNLVLANEWQISSNKSQAEVGGAVVQPYSETENMNYYVSGAYRFLDWFEAGVYYSYKEADKDGSGATNELKDICVATRFDVTGSMVLKFEVHSMDGLFLVEQGDDGNSDDSWMLYAAKVSYTF